MPEAFVWCGRDRGIVTVGYLVFERPWTTNAERAGNRFARQEKVKMWRGWFREWTLVAKPPLLTDAKVDVFLDLKGRLQDTAACNPAVKSAIDGMVDGNLFVDDTGDHVTAICFHAPVREKDNCLLIVVKGREHGAVDI